MVAAATEQNVGDLEKKKAQDLKDLGNKEYKSGSYLKAAGLYTKAIKADPNNHVLYSNRCAALLQLSKITKALADAEMAIKINPTWGKVRACRIRSARCCQFVAPRRNVVWRGYAHEALRRCPPLFQYSDVPRLALSGR